MLKNCWKNVNLQKVHVQVRSVTTLYWRCLYVCVHTFNWTCKVHVCDPKSGRNPPFAKYAKHLEPTPYMKYPLPKSSFSWRALCGKQHAMCARRTSLLAMGGFLKQMGSTINCNCSYYIYYIVRVYSTWVIKLCAQAKTSAYLNCIVNYKCNLIKYHNKISAFISLLQQT